MSLLALLWLTQAADSAPPAPLVVEHGATYSFRDGIHELQRGGGWLRSRQAFLDFALDFEFRGSAPDTDAGVVLRAWTTIGEWPLRGLRLTLPMNSHPDGSSLLQGIKEEVRVLQAGAVVLRSAQEWQRVRVAAEGSRLTVYVNDTLAGVFEVERYGGHLLFDSLRGTVQLRNVRMQATDRGFSIPPGTMTAEGLKKAGGTQPRLVHYVRPHVPAEVARRHGDRPVSLEMIVLVDGTTSAIRIESSDPALDVPLIAAAKSWKYTPGTLDGKPVAVIVPVTITLTMK